MTFLSHFFASQGDGASERSLEVILDLAKSENIVGILALAVSPQVHSLIVT